MVRTRSQGSTPTLTVYGATSFTARELLRYLDHHPDGESFNLILSGRNEEKLKAATKDMKRDKELVACELTDEESVRDLVDRSTVIINLAGPFREHHAEALIRACAATGTHYLDLCGERYFLGKVIIPKYDYQASTTGSCIVIASGFDSIPSDMSLYLALRTLQSSYPDASIASSRAFFKTGGSPSGGTMASAKSEAETPAEEKIVKKGEWMLTSASGPTPPPQLVYESSHPSLPRSLTGGFFFMYPFNCCVVRRSWFLSRLSEDATGIKRGDEPRHGDKLEYTEALQTRSWIESIIVSLGLMLFGLVFFGSTLTRNILLWLLPSPGSGPSDKSLRSGGLELTSISKTTAQGVTVVTTCKHKGDPGYIATNYMIVEAALSLILPPPSDTKLPPLASKGGVLTPSTALGMVLIERLNQSGKVIWDCKLHDDSKGHRD
ncbi:hypothetical protein BD324DRAFT_619686 [Kockovaella imperatae]|uniref:Saccharopine dehydrogenase NADP binding domain-containing protein n=1 Tax=Kockovaella imperatae TaxID=4999 RepID=A0A1Y1UN00_9TREE|nr:hypothetical protein BD324DRAFT_619686 [Kockovaella imperatae]ORX39430.1 hypothetical protein BD324DRAFT_619686 [Kockovaella imperatae]